jgi:hypothetical protein
MNNRSKRFERDKRDPDCRSYNYEDSTRLVQIISRIYAFYRVKGHVIINFHRLIAKWKMDLLDMWDNKCKKEIL